MHATTPALKATPPTLGAPLAGGKYAGITTDSDGSTYALILLDAKPDTDLNWSDAKAWAEAQGGQLPNRVESLLLFINLPGEFARNWHWTGTPYSGSAAWFQYFSLGNQSLNCTSAELCARAVRRLPVDPSIL